MSDILATTIAAVLLPIGLLHLVWATGAYWPFRSKEDLASTLIGAPFNLPRSQRAIVTILAGGAILTAGLLPLVLAGVLETGLSPALIGWLVALQTAVFLLRGLFGYSTWMQAAAPLEPFRTLNRRVFNPLILVIGLASGALLLMV